MVLKIIINLVFIAIFTGCNSPTLQDEDNQKLQTPSNTIDVSKVHFDTSGFGRLVIYEYRLNADCSIFLHGVKHDGGKANAGWYILITKSMDLIPLIKDENCKNYSSLGDIEFNEILKKLLNNFNLEKPKAIEELAVEIEVITSVNRKVRELLHVEALKHPNKLVKHNELDADFFSSELSEPVAALNVFDEICKTVKFTIDVNCEGFSVGVDIYLDRNLNVFSDLKLYKNDIFNPRSSAFIEF